MDFNWEMTLPPYLKHDFEALEEARKQEKLPHYYDCLLDELDGSINSAMWDNEISREQAAALREKYL